MFNRLNTWYHTIIYLSIGFLQLCLINFTYLLTTLAIVMYNRLNTIGGNNVTIGQIIKEYREEHGNISQRQFASLCGLSNGFISMLEANSNPNTGEPIIASLPSLRKIAVAMGVSLQYLMSIADDLRVDVGDVADGGVRSAMEALTGDAAEAINIFDSLPDGKKKEALDYLRSLSGDIDIP